MSLRIGELYIAVAFVPAFFGLRRVRSLNTGQRALCAWVVLSALLNAAQAYLSVRGQSTVLFTLLNFPLFAAFAFEALGRLADSTPFHQACRIAAVLYVIVWGASELLLEDHHWFSTYTGPVLWLALTIVASALIVHRFRRASAASFSDPAVLAGLATLLSYSPVVALEPISKTLYATNPSLVLILWESRAVLLIVGVALYTRALQWKPPQSS